MSRSNQPDESHQRSLREFLSPECGDMLFRQPVEHPSRRTGLCYCDLSLLDVAKVYTRGAILGLVFSLPFDALKLGTLKMLGAKVGKNIHIAFGAWIDPVYPHLIEIEDDVFIGMWARIFTHEFRRDEFRAGRVVIHQGAFIGGCSIIGCGTLIGKDATVAAGAVFSGEIPIGHTVLGNPGRVVPRRPDRSLAEGSVDLANALSHDSGSDEMR